MHGLYTKQRVITGFNNDLASLQDEQVITGRKNDGQ